MKKLSRKKIKNIVTRKQLVKSLDRLTKQIVLIRDGGKCTNCGETESLCAGHLLSAKTYATRWNLINVTAQCRKCNLIHEHDWWPYLGWWFAKFGKWEFDSLYAQFKSHRMIKTAELREREKTLKEILGGLQK